VNLVIIAFQPAERENGEEYQQGKFKKCHAEVLEVPCIVGIDIVFFPQHSPVGIL
jgi:hypothetical protein